MANFVDDTFTDSDSTALTAHTPDIGGTWTVHGSSLGTPAASITSNEIGDVTTWNAYGAYYNTATPSPGADYIVSVDVETDGTADTTSGGGVWARLSSSATLTGYLARLQSGRVFFQKFVSGAATTLGSVSHSFAANEKYRLQLECAGTVISVKCQRLSNGNWINSSGVEQASETTYYSVTDAGVASAGFAGIAGRFQIYKFDNFWAGDGITSSTFTESVSNTLSFSAALNETAEEVSNTASLVSEITFFNVVQDRQVPENVLAFTQSAEVDGLIQSRLSTLALTQLAVGELFGQPEISQNLGLTSTASVVFGVPHSAPWGVGAVAQDLGLSQNFNNTPSPNATSTLALTDEAVGSYGFESTLSFTQSVLAGIQYEVEQEISFVSSVSRGGSIWNRSGSNAMVLTSAGNGFDNNDKCGRRYGNASALVSAGRLTLFSKDGQYSVILRNPEIDNLRRTAFDRVVRETRGGDLIVYRDSSWNVVQTLLFSITALKRTTLDSLQTFFLNTLGEEITLVDWLGEEWSGVVTKPDETFTEDRDGYWTFAFEFEGTKQTGSSSAQYLGLTSVASATVVP